MRGVVPEERAEPVPAAVPGLRWRHWCVWVQDWAWGLREPKSLGTFSELY